MSPPSFLPSKNFPRLLYFPLDRGINKVLCVVPSKEKRSWTFILTHCCVKLWFNCSFVKTFVSKVGWLWTFGFYRKQSAICRCDNIISIWSWKSLYLKTDNSIKYCVMYLAKRRDHWLSPSHIVVWSCGLVALLWKMLYQRLIDFRHLVSIENNPQSAGVTSSYLYCCLRLPEMNNNSSREKKYLTVTHMYFCVKFWSDCSFVKTALSVFVWLLDIWILVANLWSLITS